jgi:hypothetical protein
MDALENWHSDHAANLINFLNTPTGQAYLLLLAEMKPPYSTAADTNDIVRQAGRREGYEKALENTILITKPEFLKEPESDPGNYPSLDDDSKWTDEGNLKE